MSLNLDALDRFAPGAKETSAKAKPQPVYSLPVAGSAYVLAFDQTLGHTGWGLLHVIQTDKCWVRVVDVGDIKQEPSPDLKGFAADAELIRRLSRMISVVFERAERTAGAAPLHVVHEMPAVRGHRSTSSVSASATVEAVTALRGLTPAMVNSQHVKTVLTGERDASKARVKAEVQKRHPETRDMSPMNNNVSDAIAVGLTWLLDNP